MTLGENIAYLRVKHRYARAQFAQLLGTDEQTVTLWELDRGQPNAAQLVETARIFEVSTDSLLGFHPKRPKQKAADFIKAHKFALSAALLLVLAVGTFLVGLIYGNVVELPPLINPSGPVYSGLMLHLVSKYRLFVKVCFGLATAFLLAAIAMFIVYWKKERPPRRGRKGTPAETAGGTKR